MRPKIRTVQFALAVFTAMLAACGAGGTDVGSAKATGAGSVAGSGTDAGAGSGKSTSSGSGSGASTITNLVAISPVTKIGLH